MTRETYWEEVMAKVHYSAFDGGRQFSSMRTLVLASNASITLSHTHFIFAQAGGDPRSTIACTIACRAPRPSRGQATA